RGGRAMSRHDWLTVITVVLLVAAMAGFTVSYWPGRVRGWLRAVRAFPRHTAWRIIEATWWVAEGGLLRMWARQVNWLIGEQPEDLPRPDYAPPQTSGSSTADGPALTRDLVADLGPGQPSVIQTAQVQGVYLPLTEPPPAARTIWQPPRNCARRRA